MMNVILVSELLDGEADDQFAAFRDFADALLRLNIPAWAFPPELPALSNLQRWVAEISHGGHSQFLGDMEDRAEPMLADILGLLRSCGAEAHAGIVDRVLHWIRANPDKAAQQIGPVDGIAPELEALDREFHAAQTAGPVQEAVLAVMLARPDIRRVPKAEVEAERRAEARRVIEETPEIQRWIVQTVAGACRAWLSDPVNMGLALASGKLADGLFAAVDVGPVAMDDGSAKVFAVLVGRSADVARNIGHFHVTEDGMTFEGDPALPPVDIFVSRAEIRRATRMALAFRLPESVGLRWARMERPFSVGVHIFRVMPQADWAPSKWRVLWSGNADWAVKGSPTRSTFAMGPMLMEKETLMQEEIAIRIADLGLRIGG